MGSPGTPLLPSPGARATATAAAIRGHLYDRPRHRFGERRFLFLRKWEELWPVVDAWRAMLTLAPISTGDECISTDLFLEGLGSYRRREDDRSGDAPIGFAAGVQAASSSPTRFYDDNSWLALALLHAHGSENRADCLALAQRIMRFVISGWTDGTGAHPGGLRWNDSPTGTTRNTCTNGPATEAAVLLHEATGDQQWLDWATRIYSWARSALRRTDFMYIDHLGSGDAVDKTIWSYNQGSMIGAGVLLNRVTGTASYLEDAVQTAHAATSHFDGPALLAQPSPFNAVYFANLRLLGSVRPDLSVDDAMATYAETMWRSHRNTDGLTADPAVSPLNASAATLSIDALLAGAGAHP